MEPKKVFEYIIHTAVGKFTGFAPCKLRDPFIGDEKASCAYHLMANPADEMPSIFVKGDAVIAVECRQVDVLVIKK